MSKEKNLEANPMEALATALADAVAATPNLQLPSPDLLDYYQDVNNRILWIQGEISTPTLEVVHKIMEINRADKDIPVEERKPIKLFIDTNGGAVTVMWSVVNAIKMSKTPVYTINFCDALSAGAHILAAGHKRFGMPGSTVLIHSGSCAFGGTAEQADSAKKYYDSLGKKADEELLNRTAIDRKVFNRKKIIDWYLSTEEALANNIIDKIVESFDELF